AQSYYQHTSGATSHAGMSLPLDEMASLGAAMLGQDLSPPNDDVTVTPQPHAIARLQRLCSAAGELAEHAPAVLGHAEAGRGLQQALIEAMMHCLGDGEVEEDRSAQRQHAAIMRRFHRTLERYTDQPLYVPQLCNEIGASERTLRTCCREHLGMSPKHYLLLRRMHLVRRGLRGGAGGGEKGTKRETPDGFFVLWLRRGGETKRSRGRPAAD